MATKSKKAAKPEAPQQEQVSTANMKMPAGFKVTKQITVPVLSMKEPGKPRLLKFMDQMRVSTYKDPDPKKKSDKPATIAGVTDMESGEVFQFLVPSVVQANLERDYPGTTGKAGVELTANGYVGKIFRIECLGKRPNKRYRDFSIFEVEAEA